MLRRFQFGTRTSPDLFSLVELLCNLAELALALQAETQCNAMQY